MIKSDYFEYNSLIHSLDSQVEGKSMNILRDNTQDSGEEAEVMSLREKDRGYTRRQREKQPGPVLEPHSSGEFMGCFPLPVPGDPDSECPACSPEGRSRRTGIE